MTQTHEIVTDVTVVGGGLAGVCAAIGAARHGAQVVLVQDRPVLGGNASSEIRVHVTGADTSGSRPGYREGGLLEEIRLEEVVRNPQRCASMFDLILWEKVRAEPNIRLLLNTICTGADTADNRIVAAHCSRESTEDQFIIRSSLYIDCSGDGRLGAEARADFTIGREGPDEYNEPDAQGPDNRTMGNTLMFCAHDTGVPVPFKAPEWAYHFESVEDLRGRHIGTVEFSHGFWWVEYGGEMDVIKDGEEIRDHLLACMMGIWDLIKNRYNNAADTWVLNWFSFVPGKRESRRLLGEHVLTENDLLSNAHFTDAVAHGGWPMDTHPSGGIHSPHPGNTNVYMKEVYAIPLRSLYSRNRENLMMAGRNHSATHMAMSSTRVMGTCAAMGQAAGTAAAMCIRDGCGPADVAANPAELQQLLLRDDQFIPGVVNEDPLDLARQATVTASSSAPDCEPAKVTDGVTRSLDGDTHQWASADGAPLPQWLQLDFAAPVALRSLYVIFDTGFARPLTLTQSNTFNARVLRRAQPETVRDYVIEGRFGDTWREIARVHDNYQRRVVHEFNGDALTAVKLTVLRTNGDSAARIFEVRAYE